MEPQFCILTLASVACGIMAGKSYLSLCKLCAVDMPEAEWRHTMKGCGPHPRGQHRPKKQSSVPSEP